MKQCVGGQLQRRRGAVELPAPIGQARFESCFVHLPVLPGSEVAILDRQVGHVWLPIFDEGCVQLRKLVQEYADRPSVGSDVVQGKN